MASKSSVVSPLRVDGSLTSWSLFGHVVPPQSVFDVFHIILSAHLDYYVAYYLTCIPNTIYLLLHKGLKIDFLQK